MVMKLLDEAKISSIQAMTETLISQVGFRVDSDDILKQAKKAGALVNQEEKIIRIHSDLLNDLLEKVPERYTVNGCNGQSYCIGGDRPYVSAIVIDPWIIDSETQKPRRPCLHDIFIHTVLAQTNDDVASVSRMDFPVTDDHGKTSSHRALLLHLLNHTKHNIAYVTNEEDLDLWFEIGTIFAQNKSLDNSGLLSFAVAVHSPLELSPLNCKILLKATSHKLPVIPTICPIAGVTAPYDVASTLLQANVECIFLAALTQLLQPGTPFLYFIGPSVCDMQTGNDQYYTLEKVLWKIAAVEIARSYRLPAGAECGGSMSWRLDPQSGAESMLFMLSALSSRADLLSGLGSCFNANGLSAEMIVIQQAFLEASEYLCKGMSFTHISQGLNDIMTTGHRGCFLMDDLTLQQLRKKAFFEHPVFDYSSIYQIKDDYEGKSMIERAREKIKHVTENYISPVPEIMQNRLISLFQSHFCF